MIPPDCQIRGRGYEVKVRASLRVKIGLKIGVGDV